MTKKTTKKPAEVNQNDLHQQLLNESSAVKGTQFDFENQAPRDGVNNINGPDLPEIRPSLGYVKRINVDHIVDDPRHSHLMFKVVNNENGQVQQQLRNGWQLWVEEDLTDFEFNPNERDQVNRPNKGYACYPVGIAKSGKPIDAYLMYTSKESYAKALHEFTKTARDQIDLVKNGQVQDSKHDALQREIGGSSEAMKASSFDVSMDQTTEYANSGLAST